MQKVQDRSIVGFEVGTTDRGQTLLHSQKTLYFGNFEAEMMKTLSFKCHIPYAYIDNVFSIP
jgi:hypothetical protein